MKITISGTLAARKRDAGAQINAHFNALAHDTLHADLLALAQGNEPSVVKREADRKSIMAKIEAAKEPREIARILKKLKD